MYTTYVNHNIYINNTVSSFINSFAEYVRNGKLLPDSGDIIISTYEKAVEHYRNRKRLGKTNWAPKYPFTVIQPNMDIEPVPIMGRLFTGFPNFDQKTAVGLHSPKIYQDSNVTISPILNRYKGSIDLFVWCSSVYELIDYKVLLYQLFGDLERYIYPANVYSYINIPSEIQNYQYENKYTNETYRLDWEANSTDSTNVLIKNLNRDSFVWPCSIRPYMKMTGLNAENTLSGGAGDELSEYKLNCTIEWEASLPTHMILRARQMPNFAHPLQLDINVGYQYCDIENSIKNLVPQNRSVLYSDSTNLPLLRGDFTYDRSFIYTITESDRTNIHSLDPTNIEITLPTAVTDSVQIVVYGRYGALVSDFHWRLKNSTTIEIMAMNMRSLRAGNYLTITIYKSDY